MPIVTVTPATPADAAVPFGGGSFTLACTCGEKVTYSGQAFTEVEARRHQAWHARQAADPRLCSAASFVEGGLNSGEAF